MIVQNDFYINDDPTEVAKNLLGKILYTKIDGIITSGIIVETEAYKGNSDRACHAYQNKKTNRNAVMFEKGGKAYVYLVYGIHYLFNIVTNIKGKADAVLIRALEPVKGENKMLIRNNKNNLRRITSGPGLLSKAMGIDMSLYGESLLGNRVWIEYPSKEFDNSKIVHAKRIGVDYAGDDALLPWRFYIKDNIWISKP